MMKKGIIIAVIIATITAIVGVVAFVKKKFCCSPRCDIADCECDGCGDCYDGLDELLENL